MKKCPNCKLKTDKKDANFCPKCGAEIDGKYKFCIKCGEPI